MCHDPAMRMDDLLSPAPLGSRGRVVLALVGTASWLAGGVATFLAGAAAGAAALVLAGAACWLVAVLVSGRPADGAGRTEAWPQVREAVTAQVAAAEATEDPGTVEELRSLQRRLEALERTGTAPTHPAEDYAREVSAAVARLVPDGQVRAPRPVAVARDAAPAVQGEGVVVTLGDRTATVLTRWRRDPTLTYQADGLPTLLKRLPAGSRLLLVVNTVGTMNAEHHVEEALGGRGRVVSWRGTGDDWGLRTALRALLEPAATASAPPRRTRPAPPEPAATAPTSPTEGRAVRTTEAPLPAEAPVRT